MELQQLLSETKMLINLGLLLFAVTLIRAQPLPVVSDIELQPLIEQVKQLIEASDYLGSPFSPGDKKALDEAIQQGDVAACEEIQAALDAHCLFANSDLMSASCYSGENETEFLASRQVMKNTLLLLLLAFTSMSFDAVRSRRC